MDINQVFKIKEKVKNKINEINELIKTKKIEIEELKFQIKQKEAEISANEEAKMINNSRINELESFIKIANETILEKNEEERSEQ